MQSNKKTIISNRLPYMSDFLWFIYKSILIGVAVYLCYQCLQFTPHVFDTAELFLCTLITFCFAAIIKHHTTTKKAIEQPDKLIIPSVLAVIGGILSWIMYLGLIMHGIIQLSDGKGGVYLYFVIPIAIIIYVIAPNLIKGIFSPFNYLER